MTRIVGLHVIKFGGSVLRSKAGFERMVEIIRSYESKKLVVVISAFSRSTSMLERAATYAQNGQQELALATAQTVIDEHVNISKELLSSENTAGALRHLVIEGADRIRDLLRGISITRELTDRTKDLLLGYGEFFAVHIVKHYLAEQNITLQLHDATSFMITDSNYGIAKPIEEPTKRRLEQLFIPSFEANKIVLTQGYVGSDINGNTTTMGKESSNFTATYIASLLEAEEVCIYTDVDGICNADPKLVTQASTITQLSYDEALLAAHQGLKVLYPTMIEPVLDKRIPLRIKSAFDEKSKGTVIIERSDDVSKNGLISVRHNPKTTSKNDYRTEMSVMTFINIAPDNVVSIIRNYNGIEWNKIPFTLNVNSQSNYHSVEIPSSKVNDFVQFSYNLIFSSL